MAGTAAGNDAIGALRSKYNGDDDGNFEYSDVRRILEDAQTQLAHQQLKRYQQWLLALLILIIILSAALLDFGTSNGGAVDGGETNEPEIPADVHRPLDLMEMGWSAVVVIVAVVMMATI